MLFGNQRKQNKKEHLIKCSRDEIHFVMTISIYKERNSGYYMCAQLIEYLVQIKSS